MFREANAHPDQNEAGSLPLTHEPQVMLKRATPLVRRTKLEKTTDVSGLLGHDYAMVEGDCEVLLANLPKEPLFDLIVTSPPYNIGKSYERETALEIYLAWQKGIIDELVPRLKDGGSLCWQVGNYVKDNEVFPLDIEFAPLFKAHGLRLRNRIVWHFGHGLHNKRRFSGRYEVVLWY